MPETLTLGAIVYPGFELLDLFGPLEMFTTLPPDRLEVVLIAEQAGPVASSSMTRDKGPVVMADVGFEDAPPLDVLLIPGGVGTLPALDDDKLLGFLRARASAARIVASVCTGSALLARAGLLDGRRATSNKQFFNLAAAQSDKVTWVERARWVDEGQFVTASGVSAGTDMALAIISRLFGEEVANGIADGAEYTWHRDADEDPFADQLNQMATQLGMS